MRKEDTPTTSEAQRACTSLKDPKATTIDTAQRACAKVNNPKSLKANENRTNSPLLCLSKVCANINEREILHDINLTINEDETHVLMGPNGAGKSTLGQVIMGNPTYKLTTGSLVFNARDITSLSADKRSHAGIFLSFQSPVEIPGVPLLSFLRASMEKREGFAMKNKAFKAYVTELATSLDFDPDYLSRELGVGFSGGEKKKLEMLQLLLLKPKLAILDETDSGLDVDALKVVSDGIRRYQQECAGSLLIITHNRRILKNLDIDYVHVMIGGRLVCSGEQSLVSEIDEQGFARFEKLDSKASL